MLLEKSGEITPEWMKRRSQSKNNTELWMWQVMKVSGEQVISSVLPCHSKNLKHRSSVTVLRWTRFTAQFYLESKGKYIHKAWGHADPICKKKGEAWPSFGSFFYTLFLLPLGQSYVNWARQECCLFHLRSSLWSSGLPLFYFCKLFPSLSFSNRHFGLLFPILTT